MAVTPTKRRPSSPNALTVPGEELPEVYGYHHPFTEVVPVAPQADVHGARARLTVHTTEVKWVAGEVVRMPALPLVCRKPEGCKHTEWGAEGESP